MKPLYTYGKIAELLAVSPNTVKDWRQKKLMPQPDIQQHRLTRWKAETIEPFLADPIKWRQGNREAIKKG